MLQINVNNLDFRHIRLIDENGEFHDFDIKKELAINEDNLKKEMVEQPSKYIYWASVLEKVRLYQENAELNLEILEGELDKEAREKLPGMGIKPTKDSVENYIKRTDRYKKAKESYNYYTYLVRRLNFIVKAFEQRKDLMQSYNKQLSDNKYYGQGAGSTLVNQSSYTQPPTDNPPGINSTY